MKKIEMDTVGISGIRDFFLFCTQNIYYMYIGILQYFLLLLFIIIIIYYLMTYAYVTRFASLQVFRGKWLCTLYKGVNNLGWAWLAACYTQHDLDLHKTKYAKKVLSKLSLDSI